MVGVESHSSEEYSQVTGTEFYATLITATKRYQHGQRGERALSSTYLSQPRFRYVAALYSQPLQRPRARCRRTRERGGWPTRRSAGALTMCCVAYSHYNHSANSKEETTSRDTYLQTEKTQRLGYS